MSHTAPRCVRRSARVVVRDRAGRVLLVRSRFRRSVKGVEFAWFVPGGGVEPGETPVQAAIRELWEETGLRVGRSALVHLACSEGVGTVQPLTGPMRDDFFHVRVAAFEPTVTNLEAHERAAFGQYRWWHAADLAGCAEPVLPAGLAGLLTDFDAAPTWPTPRQLPW